jgi:hypothetical protein
MRFPYALATLALLASPAVTLAQTDAGEQDPPKKIREVYAKEEFHDFGKGVVIFGEVKRPSGIRITGHEGGDFPSMIDERVHFKRELAKSAGFGIKRSSEAETAPK